MAALEYEMHTMRHSFTAAMKRSSASDEEGGSVERLFIPLAN